MKKRRKKKAIKKKRIICITRIYTSKSIQYLVHPYDNTRKYASKSIQYLIRTYDTTICNLLKESSHARGCTLTGRAPHVRNSQLVMIFLLDVD